MSATPSNPARRPGPTLGLVLGAGAFVIATVAALIGYRAGTSSSDNAPPTVAGGAGSTLSSPGGTLPSDAADIGFAQDMIDHHEQAIELATYAEAHAESPTVRSMAAAVIGSQRYEIGLLDQFLRDRGASRGARDRTVMGWMGMPVPFDGMAGLLPQATVVEFLNLQGAELDRRYLELMITHHEGGVHMAEWAGEHAQDGELRELAKRIVVDQKTELGDYQAALGQR